MSDDEIRLRIFEALSDLIDPQDRLDWAREVARFVFGREKFEPELLDTGALIDATNLPRGRWYGG